MKESYLEDFKGLIDGKQSCIDTLKNNFKDKEEVILNHIKVDIKELVNLVKTSESIDDKDKVIETLKEARQNYLSLKEKERAISLIRKKCRNELIKYLPLFEDYKESNNNGKIY